MNTKYIKQNGRKATDPDYTLISDPFNLKSMPDECSLICFELPHIPLKL